MGRIKQAQLIAVVGLVSLVLVLAVLACGGGTVTPTPVPTPSVSAVPPPTAKPSVASSPAAGSPAITSAQVCADLAAFQADLDALTSLDLGSARVRDVLGAIQSAITSGQAFVESARAAFGPEAQALGSALSGLQTALQGITGEGSLGDKAATIENAVDEVAAAFDALKAEVAPGCPAPQASGS
jgi:hypothetical protein